MRSVLFCRVSSKEQEETGYSLSAQEKLLRTYAERQAFSITKIFSISESASGKKQRETFIEMMGYVQKQGIKIIVCEKVDRLTRNFKDAVGIDEWLEKDEEKQIHLVKDALVLHKNSRSQEKLNWGIRILFAKNYIDNLSEEVKKGQKEKIRQGWLPTKPPLGYKTIGDKGHKIHVIDKEKSSLVKKLFDLYATRNYSLKLLTELIYIDGLRNENGNKVVKSRIHQLLTDPFYIGKNRWNNLLYDGHQDTFINKDTFNTVQQVLKSKTTPKYRKHSYLFQGLFHCAECTGTITWEIQKGHVYGHCNHYRNCSQDVWVKEHEIEQEVIKGFENLEIRSPRLAEWILKALKESHKDEISYHSTSVNQLNQKHEQLKKRLDKLYDDKLDSKISEEFYEAKFKQYNDELKTVDGSLQKHTNASLKYFELGINIYKLSQRAKEIYLKAAVEDKRQLINLVFQDLKINNGTPAYIYTKPFEILANAVKSTNSSKELQSIKKQDKNFELNIEVDTVSQEDNFYSIRPILLRD